MFIKRDTLLNTKFRHSFLNNQKELNRIEKHISGQNLRISEVIDFRSNPSDSKIIIINFFAMNFFDDLDAQLNDNSLDYFLHNSYLEEQPSILLYVQPDNGSGKQVSGSNNLTWNEIENKLEQKLFEFEENPIVKMKSARILQEEKVKKFLTAIQVAQSQARSSQYQNSQSSSPKRKKIRKMTSCK